MIDPAMGYCTYPRTVVDPDGNGMAVWGQFDGVGTVDVMASRYVADEGWADAVRIELSSYELLEAPSVAVDNNGNVTVVWSQNLGPVYNVFSSQYRPGFGWTMPEVIQDDPFLSSTRPSVATDGRNNAMAVWTQSDTYYVNVSASLFVPGVGWGPSVLIEDDYSGNPSYPQVAMDAEGNAVAAWRVWASPIYEVWANEYTVGVGWGTAHLVETVHSGTSSVPSIAMDRGGNATVVWQENILSVASLISCRYVVGEGWGAPEFVEYDDSGHVLSWDIAADDGGNAMAVWAQSDGVRGNILSSRYVPGVGWSGAESLEEGDDNAATPTISMYGGNAVAAWTQFDGYSYSAYANEYEAGTGWRGPHLIEEFLGQAEGPQVATGAHGTTLAVWLQHDGAMQRACANTYVAPDVTPPMLRVDEPLPDTTTQVPVLPISGATEPGATLSVGGMLVAVDGVTGEFSTNLALSEGANVIEVVATDPSGNSESVSLSITFEDPVPVILADLVSLGNDLGDVVAAIADLRTDLEATSGDVDDIQASLDGLSDGLAALEDEVQGLSADMGLMSDDQSSFETELQALLLYVEALSTSLNNTQTMLDDALSDIDEIEGDLSSDSDDAGWNSSAFVLGLVGGLVGAVIVLLAARMATRPRDVEDEDDG